MEVTVLETGGLPAGTVISFHTGSIRRHAQIEKNKAINLSTLVGSELIRVDLMSLIGSDAFDLVPGKETYEVPICASMDALKSVKLQVQIQTAPEKGAEDDAAGVTAQQTEEANAQGLPVKKLQTALMMRSYLDNHDVLRQMQDLLQEMVAHRPKDPVDYMIQRLEQVCRESQGVDLDLLDGDVTSQIPNGLTLPQTGGEVENDDDHESDYDNDAPVVGPDDSTGSPRGKTPRRQGVSAEAMKDADSSWTPPVYPKSPEERQQLSNIIRTSHDSKMHMLFGSVSKETFEKIVDACELKAVTKGENVIEQGDVGDYFYIVKSGDFDIYISKGEEPPKKVFQAGAGFAFGELALLYNAPRSATISATVPSEVFALDRKAFRNLVVKSSEAQFKQRVEFLDGVDVFQVLNDTERASLAEVLEEEEFEDDEAIVEQGERDDKMFILLSGQAVACIQGEQGEVEVMTYTVGNYFGEIALLSGEPRKASVYAKGLCTCFYISRATFMRVLGSLSNFLERNMGKYEKYQDAIASAVTETAPEKDDDKDIADDNDGVSKVKTKRKRERRVETMENLDKLKPTLLEKIDAEPATLADKVAKDFENQMLVSPVQEFAIAGTQMSMYGGLVVGQKFTMDKTIHCFTAITPEKVNSGDDKFCWNGSTRLQQGTDIGVICQKGQKSASDPTPNQDNFFVQHKNGISMYGVCDGHGPFGHLVSFRLVQSLPHFLTNNEHYGKDWELALKDAFLSAQKDLCDFCQDQNINIEASGAAGSVLVLEEQTVHIAFIGDARIMLGSWNRRDSRMIFSTSDHKPENAPEKARLESSGSEVREIDPGSFRIYLPGSNFPGLTMSRAFGDTACPGVLREPEYHKFLMQPTDQWYTIIASDGIWEFLEGSEVCNLTAKKLRLKGPQETLNFLVQCSRKRWNYCCGDYCDDITAIIVQWNADNKESKTNHSLTVKRPGS